jgi:hypothetical protein
MMDRADATADVKQLGISYVQRANRIEDQLRL